MLPAFGNVIAKSLDGHSASGHCKLLGPRLEFETKGEKQRNCWGNFDPP